MSQEIIRKIQQKFIKKVPEINVGDTVVVHTIIRDGDKQRIQKFQGMIIAIKGAGTDKMFTVRKISYGVGVEKIFPLHSTNIDKIEVLKHAKVRRSKLYYMRGRIGKAAMKLKPGSAVVPFEGEIEDTDQVELADEAVSETTAEEVVAETSSEEAK